MSTSAAPKKVLTIYDTFAECCSRCGSGKESWHHNPPIGGSALDHDFVPSRSVMEALTGRGMGRPFAWTELTDFEFYHLRSWALKGLEAAAQEHEPCEKPGCDICTMREQVLREAAIHRENQERSRSKGSAESAGEEAAR